MRGFFVKGFQLDRVLVAAMASLLLLFSTACSRVSAADSAAVKDSGGSNPPGQVQPYKGGMNNFDDVDTTRLDKTGVDAKAKALRDRVERNINQKGIDSTEQYVKNFQSGTPLNERIGNIGDDIGQSAKEIKDSFQGVAERGSKDLKQNTKGATGEASRTFDQAKQNAKAASKDISRGVAEPIDKAGKVLDRASEFAQDKVDDAASHVME